MKTLAFVLRMHSSVFDAAVMKVISQRDAAIMRLKHSMQLGAVVEILHEYNDMRSEMV